jgi:hypothetical protein
MRRHFLLFVAAALAYDLAFATDLAPAIQEAALRVATAWTEKIDAEQFGEAWESASPRLKSALSKPEWIKAMQAVRSREGKIQSRALQGTELGPSENSDRPQLVVVRFRSATQEGASVAESVTTRLESDGEWRVSGYFIRR